MQPKILIIDSHPVYIEKLEGFLRSLTFHDIETARTGQEGIEKISLLRPEIIILSGMLADMTGVEACLRIREKSSRVKIIVLTGLLAADREIGELKLAGADQVLIRMEKEWRGLEEALISLTAS